MPPSSGSLGSANKANSKASLSSLQQQQQQIMAQMQITQQALMLGQNMDSDEIPMKQRSKDSPGVLPDVGFPIGSSFQLNSKKQSKQVLEKSWIRFIIVVLVDNLFAF